jgi:magnesium transporter
MPELRHKYGYVICMSLMALTAFGQLFFFWKKGWLRKDA